MSFMGFILFFFFSFYPRFLTFPFISLYFLSLSFLLLLSRSYARFGISEDELVKIKADLDTEQSCERS